MIQLVHGGGANPSWSAASLKFAEEVRARSGGAIQVEVHDATQRGEDDRLAAVQSQRLGMALVSTRTLSQLEPALTVFELPYLMPTYKHAYKVLDGEIGQELAQKLIAKGVRHLAYWEDDYRQLSNSQWPVTGPRDMEGLKIHVPETLILMDWLRALEAVPSPAATKDLYMALQQRAIDGQDNGIFATYAAKYHDVQPYYTVTQHVYEAVALVVNERLFGALSREQKELIQRAAHNARDYQRRLSADLRAEKLNEMKRAGLKVSELSPQARDRFREKAQPVYEAMSSAIDAHLVQRIFQLQ
jgi:tripartite ATP-independent transporter DctP family solute receptor